MGQPTNAILFYGFASEDEDGTEFFGDELNAELRVDGYGDWEGVYAKKAGIALRADHPDTEEFYDGPEYDAYWHAMNDAARQSGCLIACHCSGSCCMPYVAVRESETTANRGYPERIDLAALATKPQELGWDALLKDFCETLGMPYQQPGWILASYWGC